MSEMMREHEHPPQREAASETGPLAGGEHGVRRESAAALRQLAVPIVLVALCGVFTAASKGVFLSPQNLSNLAIDLSITAVLALGMFLVILPGHIDLSVGSGVGLIGGVAAVLVTNGGWPAWEAMSVATAGGVLVWLGMGAIIVKERVPAFIITLGGLLVFRGLHLLVIRDATVPVSPGGESNLFARLTTSYVPPAWGLGLAGLVIAGMAASAVLGHRRRVRSGGASDGEMAFMRTFVAGQMVLLFVLVCNAHRGTPTPAVILGVIAATLAFVANHTPFGRYLYAIGGNEEAAVISGVPVARVTIAAFAILGFVVALTGFLQTAYVGSSTTGVGTLMELDAIAACVIGGTSLRGGRGGVGGVLLGALVMAVLINGMTLLAVEPESKQIARGLVLAGAVWADVRLSRR